MAISQVPMVASIGTTKITAPAWKKEQVYGMVATKNRMINQDSERAHAKVTELRGNHAVYV